MTNRVSRETIDAMRNIAVAACLAAVTGCSPMLMERKKDFYADGEPVHCTSERTIAWMDVVVGTLYASAGAGFAIAKDPVVLVGAAPLAVIHGVSAMLGFQWADECRDEKQRWVEENTIPRLTNKQEIEIARARRARVPRGFYCRPDATCVRDLPGCEANGAECRASDRAWCSDASCFATPETCAARATTSGSGAACEERE